jgi:hypothetical protein
MSLQVIGAGAARTGTMSLKSALESVGFGPCYHMHELIEHLDTDVPFWLRAGDRKKVNFDAFFQTYRAAIDFPVSIFYRELAARYPAAKVILTVRDPEKWFRSVTNTIRAPLTEPLPDHLREWGKMTRKIVVDGFFEGDLSDKEKAIACYERHNDEVKRTIPPERLLVYEVTQGWAPLCKFLNVPVPGVPFPKINTTAEFQERYTPRFRTGGS